MIWSGYEAVIFTFRRVKLFLPSRLRKMIERELYSDSITKSQLKSMETLGEKIGLDRREVYAAVPSGIYPQGIADRRRMNLFSAVLSIFIIIVGSFLFLILTGSYPPDGPAYTYTPGTRYGSISPNDFTNST